MTDTELDWARPPHIQPAYIPRREGEFLGTQFPAFLQTKGFGLSVKGDPTFTLVVPYRHRDLILPLYEAFSVPLSVDIQRFRYRDSD